MPKQQQDSIPDEIAGGFESREDHHQESIRIRRADSATPPAARPAYLLDGELVVCGRWKEVITIAGRNVFPQDVERVAALIPGVRPGGVVATMRAQGTEVRPERLVVVAEFGGKRSVGVEDRIMAAVTTECGVAPAKVVLVKPGELPRATSGKLRRLTVATWFS